MRELYPDLTFDEQLRHVWLTESRLCSIEKKTGNVGGRQICADRYLRAELELLPNATVVAFGDKAQQVVRRLNIGHEEAAAFSPPGAYSSKAQSSWDSVLEIIKKPAGIELVYDAHSGRVIVLGVAPEGNVHDPQSRNVRYAGGGSDPV